MRINKAVMLVLVSGALLGGNVLAEGGKRDGEHRFGGPEFGMMEPGMDIRRMSRDLDLDDAQREQLRNIMTAAQPEIKALRDSARQNREALKALDVNDPEVQNIATSNGALATEATLLFTRVRSEVEAVLTDEQRAKLAELKESRGDRKARFDREDRSPKKR